MRAQQGFVHIPMTAGQVDGLVIAPSDRHVCARCGVTGGDMALFLAADPLYLVQGGESAKGASWKTLALHVGCLEVLTHFYRTGRKPSGQR